MHKKVLILGGNGYIGSTVTTYLDELYEIVSIGSKDDDYNKLSKEIVNYFDYIILLAGHSSVMRCNGPLLPVWNNNVRNFNYLVGKLEKNQKLIYASSSSVYGNKENIGEYTENQMSCEFVNNYDLTKMSLDLMAKNFISEGKQIIGLRFGTVNGASHVMRVDLMINSMINSALTNNNIAITNKHIYRPILGIKDLCRSLHKIIESDFVSGIYNLSSFNSNVDTISKKISDIMNIEIIDKGDTATYNFKNNTDRFKQTFSFKFEDTVEKIVEDVVLCLKNPNTIKVKRDTFFDYKG